MPEAKDSIKIFKFFRKVSKMVGFYPSQLNPNCPFNCRNLSVLLSMTTLGLSTAAFCLFKARSIQNLGISFFTANTEFIVVISYLSVIYKMTNVFDLIEKCHEFIEKSELNNATSCQQINKNE